MTQLSYLHGAHGTSDQGFTMFLATGLTPGEHAREPEEQDMVQAFMSRAEFGRMVGDGVIIDSSTLAAYALPVMHEHAVGLGAAAVRPGTVAGAAIHEAPGLRPRPDHGGEAHRRNLIGVRSCVPTEKGNGLVSSAVDGQAHLDAYYGSFTSPREKEVLGVPLRRCGWSPRGRRTTPRRSRTCSPSRGR